MKEYLDLFLIFARIGGCTFGGGYAMLPIMQRELAEKKGWVTNEEILNYYAVGQCTPGVIAVNTSTFVGYKRKGVPGAICATLGMITPSFIIIAIIAMFLKNFAHLTFVQNAFAGIRVAVCALVLSTVIKMWKNTIKDITGIIICVAAFLLIALSGISPVFAVIAAALAGILIGKGKKEND